MGRPYKGNVEDKSGLEANVPERRSILRAFKKFYGKKEYQFYDNGRFLDHIESNLNDEEISQLRYYISICSHTQSVDHFRKQNNFR